MEGVLSALRLTPDEWQIWLFGQDAHDPAHDMRHSLIEAQLWKIAERALVLGTSIILDFGFWAKEEREDYRMRAQALGARSEVVFMDVGDEELLRRLRERNGRLTDTTFYIPEESMRGWISSFQKPDEGELIPREVV